jgi:hypothetical protein
VPGVIAIARRVRPAALALAVQTRRLYAKPLADLFIILDLPPMGEWLRSGRPRMGPITDSAAVSIIWRETLLASRFLSSSPRIAQDLCFSSTYSSERGHDSSQFDASVDQTEASSDQSTPVSSGRKPCDWIPAPPPSPLTEAGGYSRIGRLLHPVSFAM